MAQADLMKSSLDVVLFMHPVDSAGYELVTEHWTWPGLGLDQPSPDRVERYIRGKGGAPRWTQPYKDWATAHRDLARLPDTEEAALTFCNDRGLLFGRVVGGEVRDNEMDFDAYLRFKHNLRDLLARVDDKRRADAAVLFNATTQAHVRLRLNPDGRGLKIEPEDLATFMLVSVAAEIGGGAHWRACEYCGGWIDLRPDCRRRKDSRFCSNSCRVLAHQKAKRQRQKAAKEASQ